MKLCSMWSFFVTSFLHFFQFFDFPGGPDGKASVYNAGDPDSVRGSGRSPGEGNGNPLQYSCLENAMDRGAWQATVRGVSTVSDTTWRLNNTTVTVNTMMFLSPRKTLSKSLNLESMIFLV